MHLVPVSKSSLINLTAGHSTQNVSPYLDKFQVSPPCPIVPRWRNEDLSDILEYTYCF